MNLYDLVYLSKLIKKIKTMNIEKNFTTGVLSGIFGVLVLVIMMGSTSPETITKFEFHDLGDTRGVIFNKLTGDMEYKEIRSEPLPSPNINLDQIEVELDWKYGSPGSSSFSPFHISQ